MKIWTRIKNHLFQKRYYESAQTTRHNQNHFANATNQDANSLIAASRNELSKRARYEIRNNCYAKGLFRIKATDLIGTGPRPQFKSEDPNFNQAAERRFIEWAENCEVDGDGSLADVLTLAASKAIDDSGDGLIVFQNDIDELRAGRHSLRLLNVEADRLATPGNLAGLSSGISIDGKIRDGIEVNEQGKPLFYYILKTHPGSDSMLMGLHEGDYHKIPAKDIIHYYIKDRAGQNRGVPEFTQPLSIWPELRRWTTATLSAAETAADLAGVIESEGAIDGTDDTEAGETFDIERNQMLTLPKGWRMNQFKPEHPASTYKDFKGELVNETAVSQNVPYNIAAGNSSSYNYASGRLDWQGYFKTLRTRRGSIRRRILNRVMIAWLAEARLIPGYLPFTTAEISVGEFGVDWYWPGSEHQDPQKEANAQKTRIESGTTNLAIEYSRFGYDWERQLEQRARELKKIADLEAEYGISFKTKTEKVQNEEPEEKDDEDELDAEEKAGSGDRVFKVHAG